jgi:hypothetical protein
MNDYFKTLAREAGMPEWPQGSEMKTDSPMDVDDQEDGQKSSVGGPSSSSSVHENGDPTDAAGARRLSGRVPKPRVVYHPEVELHANEDRRRKDRSDRDSGGGGGGNQAESLVYDGDDSQCGVPEEALPAIKRFLKARLEQVVAVLDGGVDLVADVVIQVTRRHTGLTQGILNVYYHATGTGKRHKSRVEVATALGLFPWARSLRHLTREANFINAMEIREKQLLSQMVSLHLGTCSGARIAVLFCHSSY